MRRLALVMLVACFPISAFAQDLTSSPVGGTDAASADSTVGCTALAQAGAAGLAARMNADDQTIKAPQSVTKLTCLSGFFNGVGLNVLTNLLDPGSLLKSVEGQICSEVNSAWQEALGSAQCGLTVTGFNIGFGGLGGGTFCPKLTFGGGGSQIGSIGTGLNNTGGFYVNGSAEGPTGYPLPAGPGY